MSFLDELKRRRVARVALVYGAVAFAVIQAADLMFLRLGLPDWTVTFVLALAILGFPIALVLAWAFELTPAGVRRTTSSAGDAPAAQPARSSWVSGRTVAVVVVALLFAASAGWLAGRRGGDALATAPSDRGSIAVLPFANMSGDVTDEYFSDGLAEELLNLLARVEGLKVAARTSAFAFKGRNEDVRAIGDSLGVATVLEGSVRRDGERVRVTAQLIDVADGYHLWSDSYDAELRGIFDVQERIARAIVDALQVELGTAETLASGPVPDVAAHDFYLLGLDRFHRRGPLEPGSDGEHPVRAAIAFFERAVAEDPSYAQAWAGLALAHSIHPAYDTVAPLPAAQRTRDAARRAMELDDRLAEPYAAVCQVAGWIEWQWAEAERACDEAVSRNPSSAIAHQWRAEVDLIRGRLDRAEAGFARALDLDPLSIPAWRLAALVPLHAGEFAEAERRARVSDGMDRQNSARWIRWIAVVMGRDTVGVRATLTDTGLGEDLAPHVLAAPHDPASRERALAWTDPEPPPGADYEAGGRALWRGLFGDHESALGFLEESYARREFNLPLFYGNPVFASLREDPRFLTLGRNMGLDRPWLAESARAEAR